MATSGSTTLGVLGYLPGQSDFVRVRAAGREVRQLEDWIERGLHQARWDLGAGFAIAYPRLFHRFVYRPDNSQMVVMGVLCASVDRHRRPFPFVAFDLVPTTTWDQGPAALIRRNRRFFVALEQLVQAVGPLPHIGQVHGYVAGTDASVLAVDPADAEHHHHAARYRNFLQETACGELGGAPAGSGLALCQDLIALFGGGQDPRQVRSAMALPLSRPTFARELELEFYLALLRALLGSHVPTLSLFWQLGGAGPGSLLFSSREPTLDVFSALIANPPAGRGVRYPGAAASLGTRLQPGLTAATPLGTLLQLLGDRAPAAITFDRLRNETCS